MERKLASGHTVEIMKGEEAESLKKRFIYYWDGAIKLHPGGWTYIKSFEKYANSIYNFEVRPTDTFVLTFFKSGTTWTQEIVWTLVHNPNLDNPDAKIPIEMKFPNIEIDMYLDRPGTPHFFNDGKTNEDRYIELATNRPDPRMIKCHCPLPCMPQKMLEKCKVIYVARDVRDVITSLYHFARLHTHWNYTGTLDELIDDFIEDRILLGPYWTHLKLAWEQKDHPNFLFLFYEDLKNDIVSQVKRIDKFLGTNISEEQIQNVVKFTSFSQMKERNKDNPPHSNYHKFYNEKVEREEGSFFRKGIVGDWKNRFTPEQVKKINAWMAENLPQFGENFKYKV